MDPDVVSDSGSGRLHIVWRKRKSRMEDGKPFSPAFTPARPLNHARYRDRTDISRCATHAAYAGAGCSSKTARSFSVTLGSCPPLMGLQTPVLIGQSGTKIPTPPPQPISAVELVRRWTTDTSQDHSAPGFSCDDMRAVLPSDHVLAPLPQSADLSLPLTYRQNLLSPFKRPMSRSL